MLIFLLVVIVIILLVMAGFPFELIFGSILILFFLVPIVKSLMGLSAVAIASFICVPIALGLAIFIIKKKIKNKKDHESTPEFWLQQEEDNKKKWDEHGKRLQAEESAAQK